MKSVFKEILKRQVQPALGCTEPIAVALACSKAFEAVGDRVATINRVKVAVDRGVLKNAMGVAIPGTNGQKGIKIVAALGAICGDPNLQLRVLQSVDSESLQKARQLVSSDRVSITCREDLEGLHIEATVFTSAGTGEVVISQSHTNVVKVEKDGAPVVNFSGDQGPNDSAGTLHEALAKMSLAQMVQMAREIDERDRQYLREGIEMNIQASEAGKNLGLTGDTLELLCNEGYLSTGDFIYDISIQVARATDARMAGASLPVMSSGGSGNQGLVAILAPALFGQRRKILEKKILESIALSHVLNAYVKIFSGEISPVCGCSIAAGMGAAAAIVYLLDGSVMQIGYAIDNVTAGLAGMLCDGAKAGCAMKVVSATHAAVLSALFAIKSLHFDFSNGIVGRTPEESMKNLGNVSRVAATDNCVVAILKNKVG